MGISYRFFAAPAVLVALAFATLVASAPAFAAAEKRVALVIGNSKYLHVPSLDNPANDARLMAKTLHGLGFTLIGGEAQLDLSMTALGKAVQHFGQQLQGADVGLFYYAGHGVRVRGTNYLVPIGANPTREADVDFQMLDINLVLRQMQDSGTRLNLVVLDACRNNPFGGRGLRAAAPGLATMQAPEGTLISFATQPGNVAQDGTTGNSPFTKALAQTIRKPGLDIFRTFNEVGLQVARATGGAQQPWVSLSPIKGEFFFAGRDAGQPTQKSAQPAAKSPTDLAAQAWSATENTTSIAVLEDFIRQFGKTVYGSMARARLEELKKKQVATLTPPHAKPEKPPAEKPQPAPQVQPNAQLDAASAQLIYSPWTKICKQGQQGHAGLVCFTGKDARIGSGKPVVAAVLIEPQNSSKKLLRVTVPLGVQMQHGTRLIVDKGKPTNRPYVTCFANGCMSDYAADAELIRRLERGRQLTVQAINKAGKPISLVLPIGREFAEAHNGPPTDPKDYQAQQQKLREKMNLPATTSLRSLAGQAPPPDIKASTKLTYSPWTKICKQNQQGYAGRVCFTGKDARIGSGKPIVAAVLIEPQNGSKKFLRVRVPLGVQAQHGTRLIVDKGKPVNKPYAVCFAIGCISDYAADARLIRRLERGRKLTVQAINAAGRPISLTLPIGREFAKAHNGPPTDPKVFEAQQKKLQ